MLFRSLDTRDAALAAGDSGRPAVVPGQHSASELVRRILSSDAAEVMPPPELQKPLTEQQQQILQRWIQQGANWTAHWSFIKPQAVQPPVAGDRFAGWCRNPIDQFVLSGLENAGLTPSAEADRRTLIRRVSLDLTGLPPTPAELTAFEADGSADAYAKVVDRLLASPRFGEHFARHWMDLVRYADSHGSEGDPSIPQAWRYRDYLIRAFNADVPYDQFVREQVAGDLLAQPRVDATEGLNESALGPAHFRMVEHGYQPVDTLDEQIRNVDNQVDVLSKTFLGLTISCARCHDHKFDAISQADYYALYGILASSRPGQVTVDSPALLARNCDQLATLKGALRAALASEWQRQAESLPGQLAQARTLAAERATLVAQLTKLEQAGAAEAFRRRLARTTPEAPLPRHAWTFDQDGRDVLGGLDAKLQAGAVLKGGRLILDGVKAFAETAPLGQNLSAKTLEAWVALPSLDQRGGGVVSVESLVGAVFDAIVFAEKQKGRWLAGSDNGVRSRNVDGPLAVRAPSAVTRAKSPQEPEGSSRSRSSTTRSGRVRDWFSAWAT